MICEKVFFGHFHVFHSSVSPDTSDIGSGVSKGQEVQEVTDVEPVTRVTLQFSTSVEVRPLIVG